MVHLPEGAGDGALVVVLLHGRGSDERDLQGLRMALPNDTILVTPRAPFPGAPWGYGGGWAWYRYMGGTTPDDETLTTSLAALDTFFANLPSVLPVRPGRVVIGGFSQGSTTALAYALTRPQAVAGVVMFSGFLASHPAVDAALSKVDGLPIFWGHGTLDPMIPHALGVRGRAALIDAGARVEVGDYAIEHTISLEEVRDASAWMTRLLVEQVPA